MTQKQIATRNIKQGSTLLKPGDKITSVYVIQSGRLSLCQAKGGKTVEISQLTAGESLCDESVFGPMQWNLTALALRDTVIVEIPLPMAQHHLGSANPSTKMLLKAFSDRIKITYNELKTLKTNREALPCPPDGTAKVFGVMFHTARAVGTPQGDATVASWAEFKKYAFEVFEESVVRLEDAANILIKLGYVKLDGANIHLMDMNQIEAFFDYFGNYHFKGGYGDLLKTNPKMQKVTEEFLKVSEAYPVDRGGNANVPYKAAIDAMKVAIGNSFEAEQLFRLEQKGLYMKRTATNDGGILSFYKPDYVQMLLNWKLLREIELWNEKGFVEMGTIAGTPQDVKDPLGERKKWAQQLADWKPVALAAAPKIRTGEKKAGEVWCTTCMSVVNRDQKMCGVCGTELTVKAA